MALKYSPGLMSQIANFGRGLTNEQARGRRGILPSSGGTEGLIRNATRALGSSFGLDMRTPEEKMLAATAGIDRTTPEGQLAAIKARLPFVTDIDKQNALGQQAAQLRRQIESDKRAEAERERVAAEREAEAQGKKNLISELRELGADEVADRVENGAYTRSEGRQHLDIIEKTRRAEAETLEGQRRLIRLAGYKDSEFFSNLMTAEDAEPLSAEGLRILLSRAEEDKKKNETLDKLRRMPSSDKVDGIIEMVEAGFITGGQIGPALMSKDTIKNITSQSFKDENGNVVGTGYVNGVLHMISYETGQYTPVTKENPITPIMRSEKPDDPKPRQLRADSVKAFNNLLKEETNYLDDDQLAKYNGLGSQDKVNFNTAVISLAEKRASDNKTFVKSEMLGAFTELMNSDGFNYEAPFPLNPFGTGVSTFKMPDDLDRLAGASPASDAPPQGSQNGESSTGNPRRDFDPNFRNRKE